MCKSDHVQCFNYFLSFCFVFKRHQVSVINVWHHTWKTQRYSDTNKTLGLFVSEFKFVLLCFALARSVSCFMVSIPRDYVTRKAAADKYSQINLFKMVWMFIFEMDEGGNNLCGRNIWHSSFAVNHQNIVCLFVEDWWRINV